VLTNLGCSATVRSIQAHGVLSLTRSEAVDDDDDDDDDDDGADDSASETSSLVNGHRSRSRSAGSSINPNRKASPLPRYTSSGRKEEQGLFGRISRAVGGLFSSEKKSGRGGYNALDEQ
jgi:hypothetical protein